MAWPLPAHFEPRRASEWGYSPDVAAVQRSAEEFQLQHDLTASSRDRRQVRLLVVDAQRDFCFPRGSLYVGGRTGLGAVQDSERLSGFVYRNLASITEITCTLDTHFPFQIFFPAFWRSADGSPVRPHREVLAEQVRGGKLFPAPDLAAWLGVEESWLREQAAFYCEELERSGKYRLYLWPPHCIAGGDGHALAGVIQEARLFHAFARRAPNGLEWKGSEPLTENYSVLSPEVLLRHDGGSLARRNQALISKLLSADLLLIAGQASSHCVRSSVDDLLDEIRKLDPRLASKVHLLSDCMSAVTVPDPDRVGQFLADFTPQAEAALQRWADAGMKIVSSADPVESFEA